MELIFSILDQPSHIDWQMCILLVALAFANPLSDAVTIVLDPFELVFANLVQLFEILHDLRLQEPLHQQVQFGIFAALRELTLSLELGIVEANHVHVLVFDELAGHTILTVQELNDFIVCVSARHVIVNPQGLHGLDEASLNVSSL